MRILFMGTPDFARESLEKLYNAGHTICGVVAPPDKPKGRGMKLVACDVKQFAIEKDLPLFQPNKLREIQYEITEMNLDLIVVVSYGKFLPISILEIPKYGSINVHPSLLPKYRGPAPIQWAIMNGDTVTGTSIMKMNEKMDGGDIILQKEEKIRDDETTGELWARLSTISADLLLEAVDLIEKGKAQFTKQDEKEVTIAPMITKNISKIDWKGQTSLTIKNIIRGLNPAVGAYCYLGQKKLKIWKIDIVEEEITDKCEPGTVIMSDSKKGLYVKTIDGAISVLEIQGENSKKMDIKEFLRGNKIEVNKKLT